jgi:branched-chain amino acid transport system ATP-binding protein
LNFADRAYVLETGAIALAGAASALREDPHVRELYLGL